MRMVHYYGALALLAVPALLASALTGLFGASGELHVTIGLVTGVTAVALHSLMVLFMIVTGRVIKAAMASRTLDPGYLAELNRFFGRERAYPAALLAALSIVAAGVLGYAQRGFGLSPAVHLSVGIVAVIVNLWAIGAELRTLRENQGLLDRTALELDRLDRGKDPSALEKDGADAGFRFSPAVRWVFASVVVWGPVLYWGLVVWRGAFERVSPVFLWSTGFASAFCVVSAWLTRGLPGARPEPSRGGE